MLLLFFFFNSWTGTCPHRLLRTGLSPSRSADSGCFPGRSPGSASRSAASPGRTSRGRSDALSVLEPAQRFSCSRRLYLAVSPMSVSAEDGVFTSKTDAGGGQTHPPCVYFRFLVPAAASEGGGRWELWARHRQRRERESVTSSRRNRVPERRERASLLAIVL